MWLHGICDYLHDKSELSLLLNTCFMYTIHRVNLCEALIHVFVSFSARCQCCPSLWLQQPQPLMWSLHQYSATNKKELIHFILILTWNLTRYSKWNSSLKLSFSFHVYYSYHIAIFNKTCEQGELLVSLCDPVILPL